MLFVQICGKEGPLAFGNKGFNKQGLKMLEKMETLFANQNKYKCIIFLTWNLVGVALSTIKLIRIV